MDEKKAQKEESTTDDFGEGNKLPTAEEVKNINSAAERMEAANRKQEELLNRQEELLAKQKLMGRANAGNSQKKEETPEEYADKVWKGDSNPLL